MYALKLPRVHVPHEQFYFQHEAAFADQAALTGEVGEAGRIERHRCIVIGTFISSRRLSYLAERLERRLQTPNITVCDIRRLTAELAGPRFLLASANSRPGHPA